MWGGPAEIIGRKRNLEKNRGSTKGRRHQGPGTSYTASHWVRSKERYMKR